VLGVVAIALIAGGVAWWLHDDAPLDAAAASTDPRTSAELLAPVATGPHVESVRATRVEEVSARPASKNWIAPSDPLVVRGRVTTADGGDPIAGARVGVDHHSRSGREADEMSAAASASLDPETATTDADGRYELRIASATPDEFKLAASAPGFGRREQSVPEFLGTELTADFELWKGRRASGRVIDVEGRPVEGAAISAHASTIGHEGVMSDFVTTMSSADGTFLLADLRPDLTHVLQVRKPGFGQLVYAFLADEQAFDEVPFGDLVIPREMQVEVTTTDDAGQPLTGVSLFLSGGNADWMRFANRQPAYDRRDLWTRRGLTDATGRCTFAELGVGQSQIGASLRGRPPPEPVDVSIDGTEPVKRVKLTFPGGARITGRVLDEKGRPFANAPVFVQPTGVRPDGAHRDFVVALYSDAAGWFEARGLGPGTYRIGTGSMSPWFADGDPSAPHDDVVVAAAGASDVEIRSRHIEWDTIRGRVRDGEGQPIAFAWVKGFVATDQPIVTRSRVGGRFALTVPRGVRVRLIAGPEDIWPLKSGDALDLASLPSASAAGGEVELTYCFSR
jgi:protocatechuate 3,4-dioxygenase beta subunit